MVSNKSLEWTGHHQRSASPPELPTWQSGAAFGRFGKKSAEMPRFWMPAVLAQEVPQAHSREQETIACGITTWQLARCRGNAGVRPMAVSSLKLTDALDAQLTEQTHRRRLSKSELV